MKVILTADVKKVGVRGALVTVADGYGNNVLIPKKLAIPATPQNIANYEKQKAGERERNASTAAEAKKLLDELNGKSVTIQAKANPTGGLFVAIHEKQVAEAIQKQLGASIPQDAITLPQQIKKLGEFRAELAMLGASGNITIEVSRL